MAGTETAEGKTKKKISRKQRRAVKDILTDKRNRFFDFGLFMVILLLSLFGLLMLYSTTGDVLTLVKQAVITLVGFLVIFILSRMDYHWFAKLAIIGLLLSYVLMVLVDFTSLGIEANGQKRWFGIMGRSIFQAAEPVKIAFILFAANYLSKNAKKFRRTWFFMPLVLAILIPWGLVTWKNLSSGIILFGIVFVMAMVCAKKNWPFLLAIAAFAGLMLAGYFFTDLLVKYTPLQDYQLMRIFVWKDPLEYAQKGGYQILQGLYAIGSGGFFGKGLGQSMQKYSYLPEAQNDMIFCIVCEELGLFGAICVILLFVYLIWRLMHIANNAPDLFGALLVVGVMAHISIQVVMNIAVATNSMPNTGVTLPFISAGGTSLIFLMAEMGAVFSVAGQIKFKQ